MRKLGVGSRVAAVVEAGRLGLLGPVPLSKAS
jgi:DNA-binding CsgD family transcriptional regulator